MNFLRGIYSATLGLTINETNENDNQQTHAEEISFFF